MVQVVVQMCRDHKEQIRVGLFLDGKLVLHMEANQARETASALIAVSAVADLQTASELAETKRLH